MKNILHINSMNADTCDLLSNVNDGTNKFVLDIQSDISLNPTLEIAGRSLDISRNYFTYEIPESDYVGSGLLTFRIVDDNHTGEYFQISKVVSASGNLILKKTSNFVYVLSLAGTGGGGATTVSVNVGSTQTLLAGSSANVYNSGDETNVVLEFSIPQGATGSKGDKGDTGETGPQGAQGSQGPKGDKGDKGDTGESGVTTPVNGFFTLAVDSNGNLWAYSSESGTTPTFEYDADTGNLYAVTEVE